MAYGSDGSVLYSLETMAQHYTTNNTTPWVTDRRDGSNQAQLMTIDSNGHLLNNYQQQQAFNT